jgi:hypothetical protein
MLRTSDTRNVRQNFATKFLFFTMKNENFFAPESKSESDIKKQETFVKAPKGCYFIHGVKDWSKQCGIGIRTPEISCSLQKDKHTQPIRPYGYILKLDKGAISSAYDRDVTSRYYDNNFKKKLSEQTERKKYKNYGEAELDILIENTQKNSHNELWVNGEMVEIIGAYVKKSEEDIPGVKAFIKACGKENIPIHWIE